MPRLGIEPRPPGPKSDTLPRRYESRLIQGGCTSVDKLHSNTCTKHGIKAGSYREAVQVLINYTLTHAQSMV